MKGILLFTRKVSLCGMICIAACVIYHNTVFTLLLFCIAAAGNIPQSWVKLPSQIVTSISLTVRVLLTNFALLSLNAALSFTPPTTLVHPLPESDSKMISTHKYICAKHSDITNCSRSRQTDSKMACGRGWCKTPGNLCKKESEVRISTENGEHVWPVTDQSLALELFSLSFCYTLQRAGDSSSF